MFGYSLRKMSGRSERAATRGRQMSGTSLEKARAAKAHTVDMIGDSDDVVGVGITKANGGFAVKVNYRTDGLINRLPDVIDGVQIVKEVVGNIRKL